MRRSTPNRRVLILQRILPHYRVAFFCELFRRLEERHISLRLLYGQERPGTVPRTEPLDEPWAVRIRNRYVALSNREVVWQPCVAAVMRFDLVIVEQANRLLLNYPLLAARRTGRFKLALWGHGGNFRTQRGFLGELVRRVSSRQVDWWFAYNGLSRDAVLRLGYPDKRITVVNNTIDTRGFEQAVEAWRSAGRDRLQEKTGTSSDHVALFCGGMYPDKELPFLLDACRRIREDVPDFEAVFVGDGPDARLVREAARRHPWVKYAGHLDGADRAPYFAVGSAMLMPGNVGLAAVDSLTAGIPLFTTSGRRHAPEIAYIENGKTGRVTDHDPQAYARSVSDYLNDPDARQVFRRHCRQGAVALSVEGMASRFSRGVEACLRV